ncbi:Uncharacterised protein [uncultured archaeon]|nr:Uncharacterised protein [uncultured archaeon]
MDKLSLMLRDKLDTFVKKSFINENPNFKKGDKVKEYRASLSYGYPSLQTSYYAQEIFYEIVKKNKDGSYECKHLYPPKQGMIETIPGQYLHLA